MAEAPTCRVNYVGSQGVIAVNNSSGAQVNQTSAVKHVTVTPLVGSSARVIAGSRTATALHKFLIKEERRETKVKYLL